MHIFTFFHRKKVCDNNCEPSKSLVDTPPIDGSKFFKYVHKFKCLATIPLSKFPEYCCEPFKNRKELYETLDRLRKNNSESKDFENNEMEKILYRMFSSDYSLSFSIDGFGISESGMIYCLKCLKNSTNARVPSTVDSDGMLISEKKPDEYKDGFSRERKLIKDHIRDLLKQIAILNSDIYDLSIFNKTTIDEYWKEKEEVGRLKEEVWKYYIGEHNEGDYEKGQMHKASHEPRTVVIEQHNHNCQQFMGEIKSSNFITQSKDEAI